MKTKLTIRETCFVAVMLFGMFFGAGNLIFPAYMGWQAGSNVWIATLGFLITGVGLPLLGVAAIGITRSNGLLELSGKVGRGYSIFFTCALYLTIGPFFAIPRCATVPFTVGVKPLFADATIAWWVLPVFSLAFFAIVLGFSLKPAKILTSVGKILTPLFLLFFGALIVVALINPIVSYKDVTPVDAYAGGNAFFKGFLEGYNTMDALASLAFGIVVINVIRGLGVDKPEAVAGNTVRAGIFSCLIMALIYIAATIVGAQCWQTGITVANGGDVLAYLANHYFGTFGTWMLAITVTLACLKTSVGLITSCAETFVVLFPRGPKYRFWAILFSSVSFLIANVGLDAIISYSVPVLVFLYPLAITLILLGLFGRLFGHNRAVYCFVTGFTLVAALLDLVNALLPVVPEKVSAFLHFEGITEFAKSYLPFFKEGLGWVCPAGVGLLIGLVWMLIHRQICRRRESGAKA